MQALIGDRTVERQHSRYTKPQLGLQTGRGREPTWDMHAEAAYAHKVSLAYLGHQNLCTIWGSIYNFPIQKVTVFFSCDW